jgi:hypothetical protein
VPEAVDVGSVLGGRYKVTAYVLASAEKDLVLDGVDQVLNRPVSILVASAGNASQVATSARELATGDRNGNIQVLDLGITESGTYLVTNRAPAADMLDLIVQQDAPSGEPPYVEPFFTDTLGSEIFGRPRSTEPETYDDDDDEYDDARPPRKSRLSGLTRRFARSTPEDERQDDTSDIQPVVDTGSPSPRPTSHLVPPPPSRKPGVPAGTAAENERQVRRDDDTDRTTRASATGLAAAGAAGAATAAAGPQQERAASRFPLSGGQHDHDLQDSYDTSSGSRGSENHDQDEDDDDDSGGRTFTRVLVGAVLTVVLIVAVVLAATQLGTIFGGNDVADGVTEQTPTDAAAQEPSSEPPSPSEEPTAQTVIPQIAGITRLVPDNQALDAGNDVNLPLIIDGNPSSYWGNQVYASETFGGLATSLALVVELEEESTVSQVVIEQLNGTGGSFSVLLNDEPSLDGAEQIAQGGFTAPTVTLPIPDGPEGPRTGSYVIVNFTQLPRLSNIQAQYPFGLRVAEISVS